MPSAPPAIMTGRAAARGRDRTIPRAPATAVAIVRRVVRVHGRLLDRAERRSRVRIGHGAARRLGVPPRGTPPRVGSIAVGPGSEERRAHFRVARCARDVQGGLARGVACVDCGARAEQCVHHVSRAGAGGQVQRRRAAERGVHGCIGPVRQERLDCRQLRRREVGHDLRLRVIRRHAYGRVHDPALNVGYHVARRLRKLVDEAGELVDGIAREVQRRPAVLVDGVHVGHAAQRHQRDGCPVVPVSGNVERGVGRLVDAQVEARPRRLQEGVDLGAAPVKESGRQPPRDPRLLLRRRRREQPRERVLQRLRLIRRGGRGATQCRQDEHGGPIVLGGGKVEQVGRSLVDGVGVFRRPSQPRRERLVAQHYLAHCRPAIHRPAVRGAVRAARGPEAIAHSSRNRRPAVDRGPCGARQLGGRFGDLHAEGARRPLVVGEEQQLAVLPQEGLPPRDRAEQPALLGARAQRVGDRRLDRRLGQLGERHVAFGQRHVVSAQPRGLHPVGRERHLDRDHGRFERCDAAHGAAKREPLELAGHVDQRLDLRQRGRRHKVQVALHQRLVGHFHRQLWRRQHDVGRLRVPRWRRGGGGRRRRRRRTRGEEEGGDGEAEGHGRGGPDERRVGRSVGGLRPRTAAGGGARR
eukprot:1277389-Prymnesium_polylepis.2